MEFRDDVLDPRIIACIRDERDVEFELRVKRLPICLTIAVDEVSGVRHLVAALTKQPLIDLHLPLIPVLPFFVERHNGFILRCTFVVDDDVLALRILPQIVNRPEDQQVRRLMQALDAGKRVPPFLQLIMRDRTRIDVVSFHQRMLCAIGAIDIKLELQQMVDG